MTRLQKSFVLAGRAVVPHAVAGGLALASVLGPDSATAMVRAGDAAPDFALATVGGTTHTLSQYRGKVVLLAFIGYG